MVLASDFFPRHRPVTVAGFLFAASLFGAVRSSPDYAIVAETFDSGGQRSSSANAVHDGSFGGVGGVSSVTASARTVKHGFIGQLYDEVDFIVLADAATLDEGASRQLAIELVMDDASTLPGTASAVSWAVVSGPLGVNASGLTTASAVYTDTPGRIRATRRALNRSLDLTVLNTDPDNFQSYGGDGIDDDWQVNFFGTPPNTLAGPGRDPDGDGQDNLYEFLGLLDPSDPASRLVFQLIPVPGAPLQRDLVFAPVSPQRSYTVESSLSLDRSSFAPLADTAVSNNANQRTVRHTLAAPEPRRFYRIEISRE